MRLILCHVALVRALHSSQRVLKRRDIGAIATAAALPTRTVPAVAVPPACDDAVAVWSNGNRQVYIVGTAHVSEKSAELVAQTIDAVQPTLVMLELDRKRLKGAPAAASSASTPQPPRRPSLLERTGAWVVGSLLSSLYKSLDDLGLNSGREFSVALTKARENNIQILLADRDVDETLRRLSAAIQQTTSQKRRTNHSTSELTGSFPTQVSRL
jgi:pheromone shutdown protein TraB